METKRNTITRRDFIKLGILAVAGTIDAACRKIPEPEPTSYLPTIAPTDTPFPTETLPTETTTAVVLTPEQRFQIDKFNFFNQTPFSLVAGPSLRKLLGHSFDLNVEYNADLPLPVLPPEYGIDYKPFIEASTNRPNGNPVLVLLTNQPNHLIISDHSLRYFNPTLGSLGRELMGWAHKNPERVDELYSETVTFKMDGKELEAQIVNLFYVSEGFWMGNEEQNPRWEYQGGLEFIDTEILGIPETIRMDTSPDFMYITVESCLGKDPGVDYKETPAGPGVIGISKSEAYLLNTYNRAIVTFKIPVNK